jgi:hypothetical protein
MTNVAKEWRDLHDARRIMKGMRKELDELNKLMILAWKETMQAAK